MSDETEISSPVSTDSAPADSADAAPVGAIAADVVPEVSPEVIPDAGPVPTVDPAPATDVAVQDVAEDSSGPVSVDEARGIFADRHDVASVLTTEGTINRDGTLS